MLTRSEAIAILEACDARGPFHALRRSVVESLLEHADARRYRKARNAPGSRGRMFHAYLTRRAESLTAYAEDSTRGRNCTGRFTERTRTGRRAVWATNGKAHGPHADD